MADVVKEKLALLRGKLDQIPALQQAEVSFAQSRCTVDQLSHRHVAIMGFF
jgi:hypothetical protein